MRFLQVDDVVVIDNFKYPLSEFLIDQPSYVPVAAPYTKRRYVPAKGIHQLFSKLVTES